jgi:hypothetical protein
VSAPSPVWTTEELTEEAAFAASLFRVSRLEATTEWPDHYQQARAKFQALFDKLSDLNPEAHSIEKLADAYKGKLGEAIRYLAGPPISDDDLAAIAAVESIAGGKLAKDQESLRKVYAIIERVIDPYRFPWIKQNRAPSAVEREAALLASAVLLAAQTVATQRRNEGKEQQEAKLKDFLRTEMNFTEVRAETITTLVRGPQTNQFCSECQLGERKADVVVRLHDTRLMPIECKVSNSATNSVKRLNNDAAVKARYWVEKFGTEQVVPAALLSGVFNVLNLEQAQKSRLTIFWAHKLGKLREFIDSTR